MNFQDFITRYEALELKMPIRLFHSLNSEGIEYGDFLYSTNNALFSFDCAQSENIIYINDSFKAKNSYDGNYIINSEGCYESFDVFQGSNNTYLNNCNRIYNSHFCWDCDDSHDLFGCSHLRHKEYCIFNKQYTKDEYKKFIIELQKKPAEDNLQMAETIALQFPITTTHAVNSENCDYGNHITNSKNLYLCFDTNACENGGYLYDTHYTKYSYDMTQCAHCEHSYECSDSAQLNNCFYMSFCSDMYDSGFCENCTKSNHLFGCVTMENKEYRLLNRQLTKEEYAKEVNEILISFNNQQISQVLKKLEAKLI